MLLTKRLLLRRFTEEDIPALDRILSNPVVLRYFPPTELDSSEMARHVVERSNQHWEHHGYGPAAVELVATGELLGRAGLQYLHDMDLVEVDYLIGVDHWRRGYATEAAREWVAHGFESLHLKTIIGLVHVDNTASARVLEKIGMTYQDSGEYFGLPCKRYESVVADWYAASRARHPHPL